MIQICKSVRSLFGKYVTVKPAVIAIASLSILSLTANAATIEMWQLDNFFTNLDSSGAPIDPDNAITPTNIKVGDTVNWTNNGSTEHTTTNANNLDAGIFEGVLWDSNELGVGESFSFTFNDAGEFPYFCKVHGEGDMEGTIFVTAESTPTPTPTGTGTPGPTPTPGGGKRFTFQCDKPVTEGPSGIETLVLAVGETASCVLQLNGDQEDQAVMNVVRGNSNVVAIVSDEETADGELLVEIEGQEAGMVWTAFGINRDSRRFLNRFRKADFDETNAWGFIVEVVDE